MIVSPRGSVIAKLPLVPFVIINLTRLTAGVCMKLMKVGFKSKVTKAFCLPATLGLSSPLLGSVAAQAKPLGPG